MIISLSNSLIGITPAIITGSNPSEFPEDITNPDFSRTYISSLTTLEISFGAVSDAQYVSVAGHSAASGGNGTVSLLNGTTVLETVNLTRNNTVTFYGHNQSFSDLRIRLTGGGNFLLVSYISAGLAFEVPNDGEQSGYGRNWLSRPITQRSTTNSLSSPVALLNKRVPLRGSLSIPNASTLLSRGDWQVFYDFIETLPFFILEVDDLPESSYVCFEPKFIAPKAHPSTRVLDALSISFLVSNGL